MATEPAARGPMLALLLIAALLAGCATAPPPAEQPPPAPAAVGAAPGPDGFPTAKYASGYESGGRVYRIASADSQIDVRVYRAGKLARLGHNHIITSRAVSGFVFAAKDAARSRLDLYFPVDSLSIDEPELRAAAGDDFASQPSANDIAGTRKNLLGERMLDAEQYPYIVVSGRPNGGTASDPELDLTIKVRGAAHAVHVATTMERDGDSLRASGVLRLSHAQLGLEPFSILGGAIAVEDSFDVHYRITARAL